MTTESINKHWPVILAFKEGKKIQYLEFGGGWKDTDNPTFYGFNDYRVKPEPKWEMSVDEVIKWNNASGCTVGRIGGTWIAGILGDTPEAAANALRTKLEGPPKE